jgi:hypothetical protein
MEDQSVFNYNRYNLYTGDFNGDGITDILLQGRITSTEYMPTCILYFNSNGSFDKYSVESEVYWASNYRTVHVADFNGDGRMDVLLQGGYDADGAYQKVICF